MPAYLVGQIRVTNPAQWQRYVERVGATFPPHGGEVLFRGERAAELARSARGERIVVARFATMAALRAWHDSPACPARVALREAGAEVVLTACEGQAAPRPAGKPQASPFIASSARACVARVGTSPLH
jgi:uncharacterized protein (DUF1330 family)